MITWEKNTYKDAVGYGFWRSKRYYCELWIFPSGFEISPHCHPDENVETILLFGKGTFSRKNPTKSGIKSFLRDTLFGFKRLSIPGGWFHWFIVDKKWPLVVVNICRFMNGVKPTSASLNITFPGNKISQEKE